MSENSWGCPGEHANGLERNEKWHLDYEGWNREDVEPSHDEKDESEHSQGEISDGFLVISLGTQ